MAPTLTPSFVEAAEAARPTEFDMRVTEAGRGVVARVHGPLDLHHSSRFLQRVGGFVSAGRRVVVDLRDAEFVDSSGVRALLHAHKELEAARGELRLVIRAGSRVERVLKLLQLQQHFNLYQSVSEASEPR